LALEVDAADADRQLDGADFRVSIETMTLGPVPAMLVWAVVGEPGRLSSGRACRWPRHRRSRGRAHARNTIATSMSM
jgi:hypothetical protein